jgi:uncharacterized protein (DUF983 family)
MTPEAEVRHRCPRCGLDKPFNAFYRDASKTIGRRYICKACDLAKSRAYYQANREAKLAKAKARYGRKLVPT